MHALRAPVYDKKVTIVTRASRLEDLRVTVNNPSPIVITVAALCPLSLRYTFIRRSR